MVTYVALLMLLQLGVAPAWATLCSALLFVPWVLKPFMRPWARRVGHFRQMAHVAEALLFVSLMLLAFSFNRGPVAVFLALLLVSLFCAWHELTVRMYYESHLRSSFRRILTVPRHVCSQIAVIFTYGALIFLVGTLEVYFRQIRYSWSLGCYVAAGLFLLLCMTNILLPALPKKEGYKARQGEAWEKSVTKGTNGRPGFRREGMERAVRWFPLLFFLLMPQSLMFFARVLYLYDTRARGGLQCTMQEIGFAQGTVGVIAFSLGIAVGWRLIRRYSLHRCFWPMALSLVLSPFVYWGMTFSPPQSLWMLCGCTMTAQLLFGMGIGVCRFPVSAVSGPRYDGSIDMLQIPLVAAAMFLPMALSGWMVERLGYDVFFLVNALSAPVCLLGIWLMHSRRQYVSPHLKHQ